MLDWLEYLRQLNIWSMMLRVLCAMAAGGLVGFEREKKGRPAGFRTYMLVALGAALTIMLSQYLNLMFEGPWKEIGDSLGIKTDVSRLGAQVINGVGFLGAGTIIVTKRQRVKGLTTAAGLWTAAIIGLVCGAGYVECAIFATAMVLVAELLLIKIEYRFAGKINDVNLYVEYAHAEVIENILRAIREKGIKLGGIEINRIAGKDDEHHYCAVITLRANKKQMEEDVIKELNGIEDVLTVEEL